MEPSDTLKYILEGPSEKRELDGYQFCSWYYANFGWDYGNPAVMLDELSSTGTSHYVGRGYFVRLKVGRVVEEVADTCKHLKRYTNKFSTFEFEYCPDCKKEI